MLNRVFASIQKAFAGVEFKANPSTDLVMVESLKMYRSVLVEMERTIFGDTIILHRESTEFKSLTADYNTVTDRLNRVDSYIKLYSTPAEVIEADFAIGEDKSVLAVCRIAKDKHDGSGRKISVLRVLDDGDRQTSDDPRVIIMVQRGQMVRKSEVADMFLHSKDNGLTWRLIRDSIPVTELEADYLSSLGYNPYTDCRIRVGLFGENIIV